MLGSQYRPDPREDCDQIQSRNRWGISGISPAKKKGCRSTFISGPKCKLLQLNWKLDDAWGKWMYTYFNISEHMIRGNLGNMFTFAYCFWTIYKVYGSRQKGCAREIQFWGETTQVSKSNKTNNIPIVGLYRTYTCLGVLLGPQI